MPLLSDLALLWATHFLFNNNDLGNGTVIFFFVATISLVGISFINMSTPHLFATAICGGAFLGLILGRISEIEVRISKLKLETKSEKDSLD